MHKDPAFDDLDDAMDYMEAEDAHDEGIVKDNEETRVSTEDQVSTDKLKVSTDKPNEGTAKPNEGTAEPKDGNSDESASPTTVFRDDETIAQFLFNLNFKATPKIDPKDKGKKVLEEKAESDAESEGVNEAERKFAQLANDEEIAKKVQEEWEAEEEKKKLVEEEATKAAFANEYDFIQARLNAYKILAEKLQEEEREKFTIEQRSKFLHDTIAAQRRFLAQQRSEAIRNKLPTRNQLRNQMMTYLKYEDGKLIEKMNKKAAGMDKEEVSEEPESTKVKAKIEEPKENIKKRSGRRHKMKAPKRSKRQKTNSDHEEENQLRTFLKIVPEEEETIDYEVLGTIVFKADGSSRWIKTFSEMIKLFDRMDLVEIHSLVMKRFETTPREGIDLLLWGDLRNMFESKEDDELWKHQEEWKLQS
ncbi:hypothetical protein Tco_1122320 [Tanacetum coccineum]|uniref:Uncharacterized protein n=1 Tax=Tanacetum coccineum TaxID=301880 RepID=A0ABQ5J1M5_9ASTR